MIPGLWKIRGSETPWLGRWFYNLASQATGLGLTANIIDCYAAVIRMWESGDRILLFGISRGAYTVRCVGGVLVYDHDLNINVGCPARNRDQRGTRVI